MNDSLFLCFAVIGAVIRVATRLLIDGIVESTRTENQALDFVLSALAVAFVVGLWLILRFG